MSSDPNKKYKRPKKNTLQTTKTKLDASRNNNRDSARDDSPEGACPLLAKDSEWVDILQTPLSSSSAPSGSSNAGDEETVLQLVECEDGPQMMKPLAIMFPGLLAKDPETLEGMLTKAMSTTEVTKHLVDLGVKANFTFMKKATRLIPKDKQWLESVSENSNSNCSLNSTYFERSVPSDYEADTEVADEEVRCKRKRKKKITALDKNGFSIDSEDMLATTDAGKPNHKDHLMKH